MLKNGTGRYICREAMDRKADILETLEKEGALDTKQIIEKSGIPFGTVRAYTSIMTRAGLIKHYKGIKGIFEITDQGRKYLEERGKNHVNI